MAVEEYFALSWTNARPVTVGRKRWVFPGADVMVTPTAAFVAVAAGADTGPFGLLTFPRGEGKPLEISADKLTSALVAGAKKVSLDLPPDEVRAFAACWIRAEAPQVLRACLHERGHAALGYARRGWAVFPLHTPVCTETAEGRQSACSCGRTACPDNGKHPRTKHGLKDATTDEGTITEWWWEWPDANIGIVTGRRSGIAAVDVDPRHGGDVELTKLEAAHGSLPETPEQLTGGGGRHIVFADPEGCPSRVLGEGVELKGDGTYIVGAPSLHESGRSYEWEAAHHPDDVPLARLPEWVVQVAKTKAGSGFDGGGPRLDPTAVLAGVPEGQRDTTLFRYACRLRAKGLAREEAEALVLQAGANCQPPFAEQKAREKVASAWRYPSDAAEREARLADARDLAAALPERARQDPGAPFEAEVLHALALVREHDRPAWARVRKALQEAGVSVRELDRALQAKKRCGAPSDPDPEAAPPDTGGSESEAAPQGEAGERQEPDPYHSWDAPSGLYAVRKGRTYQLEYDREGNIDLVPLSNFAAQVVEETDLDNGAEVERFYTVEGRLHTVRALPPIRVPVADYLPMNWPGRQWGHGPSIAAGQGTRDHLRAALDEFSGTEVPHRTVYTHLGWRRVGEAWAYLHADGAIGADGLEVDLDPDLQRYALGVDVGDVSAAMKTSLSFLGLGDPRVTFPLWASVWRAVVSEWVPCLVLLWALGETGLFKSTVVALALSHFGGPFEKDTLPASWLDTDNRLEQRAFIAKDVLLPVDDFCPEKHADIAKDMQRRASRLIRAVGNRQGRGRLRADLSARPTYVPRGFVVSTAEQLPQLATSALARILPIPFEGGAIDQTKLSALQAQAALLPVALRGFIEHLLPQADGLGARLPERFLELRDKARVDGHHRLPESVAHLHIGLELGIGFAVQVGALDETRAAELLAQGWEVFLDLARAHAVTLGEERPARLFLGTVAEGIAAGRCWLAHRKTGNSAAGADNGQKIGWVDAEGVYVLPETAYEFVSDHLRHRAGLGLPARALWEQLRKDGLLKATEDRHLTCKPRCEGTPTRVLWLVPDALGELPEGEVREAHCHGCGQDLSSRTDRRCPRCGWLKCRGCGRCKPGCAA